MSCTCTIEETRIDGLVALTTNPDPTCTDPIHEGP